MCCVSYIPSCFVVPDLFYLALARTMAGLLHKDIQCNVPQRLASCCTLCITVVIECSWGLWMITKRGYHLSNQLLMVWVIDGFLSWVPVHYGHQSFSGVWLYSTCNSSRHRMYPAHHRSIKPALIRIRNLLKSFIPLLWTICSFL